ncbi:hypothetical protein CKM354_001030800 [Cercospora kikuchii]|uniref:Zn(2)-C6 fungal-type domain-containing protein n=1 Tax=Cercospora kikuchii TaxID=84275 RepID=A0A9P3CQQ6_9PEZI|nr:uncharacterized protein CKM354_001030800 [Cercospora kikuchii]GIZ47209.1 hypothetical protein CKM354_001030800 [Cercospora kikuchii]
MPRVPSESSTSRRHRLADFLDLQGTIMVRACSTCAKHKRVCKVHTRSGKCNECVRRGQRCDIKVTKSEFDRLRTEKEKLLKGIEDARRAQEDARRALEAAHEASRVAFAREMRLRQQMDLIDRRADDAIAVEIANIEELEAEERAEAETLTFPESASGFSLHLSPGTWGAIEGLSSEYWDLGSLADPGGTVLEAGGSS